MSFLLVIDYIPLERQRLLYCNTTADFGLTQAVYGMVQVTLDQQRSPLEPRGCISTNPRELRDIPDTIPLPYAVSAPFLYTITYEKHDIRLVKTPAVVKGCPEAQLALMYRKHPECRRKALFQADRIIVAYVPLL